MRVFARDDMITILSKAMDGLSVRHQVIADNIANVDTPGFKAGDVRFEEELSSAYLWEARISQTGDSQIYR